MEKIQLRGHCQCCGRLQAVPGLMSKHGYRVQGEGGYAYFVGVCPGERFAPMEREIEESLRIVVAVRRQGEREVALAAEYRAGKCFPAEAESGEKIPVEGKPRWAWPPKMVPFAEAKLHQQLEAVESIAWKLESHGKGALSFAKSLEALALEFHGKPLLEVEKEAGPAPIAEGEKRKAPRGVLRAVSCYRGMVLWELEGGAQKLRSKMSSRSWRLLPLA